MSEPPSASTVSTMSAASSGCDDHEGGAHHDGAPAGASSLSSSACAPPPSAAARASQLPSSDIPSCSRPSLVRGRSPHSCAEVASAGRSSSSRRACALSAGALVWSYSVAPSRSTPLPVLEPSTAATKRYFLASASSR
eukprot:scaffold68372_cov64-Phaeocystis_antarctica.AAC.8